MKSAKLNYISSAIVSQGSSWLFDFTLKGSSYAADTYDILLTFPVGFHSTAAGCEIPGLPQNMAS